MEVACLRHVRNSVILPIAFMVMCHRTVWNDDKPEKVVRSGVGYSWHSGLWTVLWTIGLKVFCKMRGIT